MKRAMPRALGLAFTKSRFTGELQGLTERESDFRHADRDNLAQGRKGRFRGKPLPAAKAPALNPRQS
ncbi:hypothetical protein [Polaromonas sp. CG_9.11]|uniref:hypothetical protein n=1 Tax=Polaromonas sp. CG_9.11 TaxID=2787730 RepID=UPI0018CAA839|nr:hypothetical protein [Polaromonas sp. CG_9.11]MBG6075171.1 hypothetical protein [Polaromonas sp. CG_9.11]